VAVATEEAAAGEGEAMEGTVEAAATAAMEEIVAVVTVEAMEAAEVIAEAMEEAEATAEAMEEVEATAEAMEEAAVTVEGMEEAAETAEGMEEATGEAMGRLLSMGAATTRDRRLKMLATAAGHPLPRTSAKVTGSVSAATPILPSAGSATAAKPHGLGAPREAAVTAVAAG